ncbi:hypothetical protein [Campylobacter helveticus]|uniref:hypothetical protein n=1 Tax=Campylobacter helveticus TaxID=28898 RepID=UPI002149C24B|nr:hypothetical protein [Campylobacter helveticus]MCR2062032.1 hypothetical protein [Campylobacter helveticus]
MSDRELALFTLCKALVTLLGEEQAIADLTLLYERHPEMFENKEGVKKLIEKVVSEPDVIKINPKAKSDKDFMVAKILDDKKMVDIGIRNDNGTNIVFHTNKKNISRFYKFKKDAQVLVETPSTEVAPTWSDHCADKSNDLSRDIKILSTPDNAIMPQPSQESQEANAMMEQMLKMQESISSMPRVDDLIKELDENSNANNDESLNNEKAKKPYQSRVRFKKQ